MGFAKPIEQIFIKLSRYIYVSKRYYTRRIANERGIGQLSTDRKKRKRCQKERRIKFIRYLFNDSFTF